MGDAAKGVGVSGQQWRLGQLGVLSIGASSLGFRGSPEVSAAQRQRRESDVPLGVAC